MLRIYVIRHGETEPNTRRACVGRLDVPLNDTGRAQAESLAKRLNVNADTVYVSPLIRAKESIAPYLKSHPDAVCHVVPELIERDFGIWENLSFKEIEKIEPRRFREWQDNYIEYKIPGGESLIEVHHRLSGFLDEMCRRHRDGTVFIVSHLCTSRQIIAKLLGLDASKSRCFTMKNATCAIIDYDHDLGFGVMKYLNI